MLNTFDLTTALQQGQHILTAIVACSRNCVIGRHGQLPWRVPQDLARFKRLTMGKYVVVGRKTMESIGRPLPGRKMVVLSRANASEICGCPAIQNLTDWIKTLPPAQEIMIAGGGEIYESLLPFCSKVYQTQIHQVVQGDTFFPVLNSQEWLLEEEEPGTVNGMVTGEFSFLTYSRKTPSRPFS